MGCKEEESSTKITYFMYLLGVTCRLLQPLSKCVNITCGLIRFGDVKTMQWKQLRQLSGTQWPRRKRDARFY